MQWLWLFLPDEALVLVVALIGLGLIVGFLRPRSAGQLLGGIVLMLLLGPFIEGFVSSLPWAVVRALSRFVLGGRAADHMAGILAADGVRWLFRSVFFVLTLPFRFIGWMFRRV
jgi:hypothetical protein